MAEDEKVVKLKILTEADSKALVEMTNALRDVAKASGNLSTDSTRDLKNFASQVESVFKTVQAATRIKPELDTSALFQQAAKVRDEFGKVIDGLGDTTKELTQQFKLQAQQMTASMSVARAGVGIQKEMAKASLDLAKAEQMRIDNLTRDERNRLALRERETKAAHDSEMRAAREMEALDKAIHTERMRQIREADAAAASASRRRIEEGRQTQVAARSQRRGGGGGIGLGINIGIGTQLVGAFTSAVSESIGIIDRYSTTLQAAQVQFTGMMGSADAARAHLQDLSDFAAKTPFDIPNVVENSRMLQAYGFAAADVIPTLTTLGNLAGASGERFSRLAYAYSEVYEKQRLYSQDLRQFETAGIPILQTLAKAYGTTAQEVKKMVEEGRIGFPHVQWALEELEKTKFADQLIKQSQLLKGELSNLKDRIGILGDKMFEPIAGAAAAMVRDVSRSLTGDDLEKAAENFGKDIVTNVKNFASTLEKVIKPAKEAAEAIYKCADAVGALDGAIAAMSAAGFAKVAGSIVTQSGVIIGALGNIVSYISKNPWLLLIFGGVSTMSAVEDARQRGENIELGGPREPGVLTREYPGRMLPGMGKAGGDWTGRAPVLPNTDAEVNAELAAASAAATHKKETDDLIASIRQLREEQGISAESIRAEADAIAASTKALQDEEDSVNATTNALREKTKAQKSVPDPLPAATKAAGAHKQEQKSIEELIEAYYALQAAMEAIKATVASGDLLGAARQLVALGKSNEQAVSEVISIQKDLAREAEQALKDAADRAKEARSAFLDLADTLLGQVTKAFEALTGASSTSAQSVVKLIGTLGAQAGKALAGGFNIPLSATVYTKPGEGTTATAYAGPAAPFSGGADMGFGGRVGDVLGRMATGLGVVPWMSGAGAGAGLIPGITAGMGGAAALAKAGASLDDINAGIDAAATALGQFGHWVGSNLTGEMKQAAGSLIGGLQEYVQMAREAEGDAEKLAYLQKVIDALTPALQNAAKAAQEYADAVAAARKAGVYFGEYDTAAVLKAQTELVTKTRQEELEAARRNVEAQMQAQRTRGKYGFTEDVIVRTAGGEETLYQEWFKARFGLTRSELDLANANWELQEAALRRAKLLDMESEQMAKRSREAQQYQRSMEERIRTAYGITQEQLYGLDAVATGDLRDTLAQLVLTMQRGINAYIEPNHAADRLGAALDQRSALLAGAGGFGPGVF